ncbi:MAG: exonuclease subunit SbcD [Chloroflexi bacterium]|nr:exonuclease subunit SbcD [Chloroflexota bacterium]
MPDLLAPPSQVIETERRITLGKIKLLHFADVHLGIETYGRLDPATGLSSRLLDFTACLDEAVDRALDESVDLAVFCGDAYRSRDPNPTCQREFAKRVRKLATSGVQVFLLVGNHDLPVSTSRANSVDIFETLAVPNVHVGRKIGVHIIETRRGAVQIIALPWLSRAMVLAKEDHKNKTLEEVNKLLEEYVAGAVARLVQGLDPTLPAILAAHVSVFGATWGSEKGVMLGQDIVVPKSVVSHRSLDYVALGHVHRHQVVGNYPLIVYAGSIERVDFGEEAEDKGFVIAQVERGEAEYTFIPVKARRFLTVDVRAESDDPLADVLAAIARHNVEGAVVRVSIHTTPDKEGKIHYNEVRRALKDAHHVAAIAKHVERKHRTAFAGKLAEQMTPREALELYLKNKQYPAERARALLEYSDTILRYDAQ